MFTFKRSGAGRSDHGTLLVESLEIPIFSVDSPSFSIYNFLKYAHKNLNRRNMFTCNTQRKLKRWFVSQKAQTTAPLSGVRILRGISEHAFSAFYAADSTPAHKYPKYSTTTPPFYPPNFAISRKIQSFPRFFV